MRIKGVKMTKQELLIEYVNEGNNCGRPVLEATPDVLNYYKDRVSLSVNRECHCGASNNYSLFGIEVAKDLKGTRLSEEMALYACDNCHSFLITGVLYEK